MLWYTQDTTPGNDWIKPCARTFPNRGCELLLLVYDDISSSPITPMKAMWLCITGSIYQLIISHVIEFTGLLKTNIPPPPYFYWCQEGLSLWYSLNIVISPQPLCPDSPNTNPYFKARKNLERNETKMCQTSRQRDVQTHSEKLVRQYRHKKAFQEVCIHTDPAVVQLLCFHNNSPTFLPLDSSAHTTQ